MTVVTRSTWTCATGSAEETGALGHRLGAQLTGGEVITLQGELGMGKTRLVQGLGEGLGLPAGRVTSPTFALRHDHAGRLPLVHIDFYRLSEPEEIEWLGVLEASENAVIVIEWADKLPAVLPTERLQIELAPGPLPDDRTITMTAMGPAAERLVSALSQHDGR